MNQDTEGGKPNFPGWRKLKRNAMKTSPKKLNMTYGPPASSEVLKAIVDFGARLMVDDRDDISPELESELAKFPESHELRFFAITFYSSQNNRERTYYHLMIGIGLYPDSPILLRKLALTCSPANAGLRNIFLDRGWPNYKAITGESDKSKYYGMETVKQRH